MRLLAKEAKHPASLGWKRVSSGKYQRGTLVLEHRGPAWFLRNGDDLKEHAFKTLRLALIFVEFCEPVSAGTFAPSRQETRGPFMLGCGECECCQAGQDCPRIGEPISNLEDDGLDNRF
jgi:hypothetical protein